MKNTKIIVATIFCVLIAVNLVAEEDCNETVVPSIRIDPGHPWRPPFGLDRVGKPPTFIVEMSTEKRPVRGYSLVAYIEGKEIERRTLGENYTVDKSSYIGKVTFDSYPTDLALVARCQLQSQPVELLRQVVKPPTFEADAVASLDELMNPVDLGMVLVPADWLLLANGKKASVDVAAISYVRDIPGAQGSAWFESAPPEKTVAAIQLSKYRRAQMKLQLPAGSPTAERDVLHVVISDAAGKEIWQKQIKTSRVIKSPHWPEFGATATKLRFDAPISVRDPVTGQLSTIDYNQAWDPRLNDVVVSLPNGSRFVFWRGSSYVPFWAGQHNTGLSYEWAETMPPPEAYMASIEPLMDKELRYGRVEIIESTAARVHVRWSYQSCDFNYKIFGDSAVEDFYFYPDGFGTRVLSLKSAPGTPYELSELIILTPQAAYPFSVFPPNLADLLYIDGLKRELSFPQHSKAKEGFMLALADEPRGMPLVYRVRLHKDDAATAIYFSPSDTHLPQVIPPLSDRGYMVTPIYWGCHWPLTRGEPGKVAIDDCIYRGPAHNSIMTWGMGGVTRPDDSRSQPVSSGTIPSLDMLGRSKPMTVERRAWLIAMTDASDARILDWARSFTSPPAVELKGARFDFESYVPERRAIRMIVEEKIVAITIKPTVRSVNPVFEVLDAPGGLAGVTLEGRLLTPYEYRWDGHTLWVRANIDSIEQLRLEFSKNSH